MRILCVLPNPTQPTTVGRVALLQRQGHQVEVMAFQRGFDHGRSFNCPVTILGRIHHQDYLERIPVLLRAFPKIRAGIRRNQVVYVLNLDLTFMVIVSGWGLKRPVILDVLDITQIQVASGLKGRLVRAVEKFVVERCHLLMLQSPDYRRYYRDWLHTNTPDITSPGGRVEYARVVAHRKDEATPAAGIPFRDRPLKIGYFATMRDQWSLECLEYLAKSSKGRFEFLLAGAVSPTLQGFDQFLERNPDIQYKGPFRHSEDISELYGSVDMILACFPPKMPFGWSRSCRSYEACLFQKPLIVRAGTGDSKEVERYQSGLIIGEHNPEDAAAEIRDITADDWLRWRTNMAALPLDFYSYTDTSNGLIRALNDLHLD